MRSRLKVVYWNNIPSPYVVSRFNEVAQRDAFDFEAWFDDLREETWFDGLREADRSWAVDPSEWKFKARFIQGRRRLGHHKLVLPLAELRSSRPDVFICNYDRLHYVLGTIVGRSLARRTALRCLPSFDAWTPPSRIRDLAKAFVFRAVDGAKVPGPDGSAYAGRYGLPIERTWTVTQSIDVAHYAQARRIDSALRAQRRNELGVTGCVFIYVGRIWSGKGLDTLVSAYRKVRAANPDVSLLLVGGGQDQQRLQADTSDLSDVVWAGFVQPAQLPDIYNMADVMVFPTLGDPNGLVVEEAMAAGLPVISTSAAGDIRARVPEGVAGYVVPPADPDALAMRMIELAGAPELCAAMGNAGAHIADGFVTKAYADDFERFVYGVLAMPRRGGPSAAFAQMVSRLVVTLPVTLARISAQEVRGNLPLNCYGG